VGVELQQFQNQSSVVARSVNEFVGVLIEAVLIVLAVSFVSLGLHFKPGSWKFTIDWRPGMVVGITIPLVLAITFVTMYYWKVGLHKISLGSLIIALGLLVDDAIIAVEMMVRKLEEGYDKMRAATFAYEATAMPMLTGTLITAVGFLPIGLASRRGRVHLRHLRRDAAALLISWWCRFTSCPTWAPCCCKSTPARATGEAHEGPTSFDTPFYTRFRALVNWCVQHRWITIGLTVLSFVLGIVGMGKVQQQFFPDSSRLEVLVDLWLPEGSTFAANEAIAKRLRGPHGARRVSNSVTTWVGSGVPRFCAAAGPDLPAEQCQPGHRAAQDLAAREALRNNCRSCWPPSSPRCAAAPSCCPTARRWPYPVQFRVVGADPTEVRQWADQVKDMMRANPNMRGVNDNWNESVKVLAPGSRPGQGACPGRHQPGHCPGCAHLLRQHHRPVPRWRQADRHRAAPAAGVSVPITDLANGYVPTASGRVVPLSAGGQGHFHLGARRAVARRPRLCRHRAGRCGGRRSRRRR
jgi:multidrug efflux pump